MLGAVARKLFGSANDRRIRGYRPRVDAINALEPELEKLSDEALRARTDEFKKADRRGQRPSTTFWCPAFATVREAAKRTLGQRHFDVQLIGGMVLHEGQHRRDEDRRRQDAGRDACRSISMRSPARGVHVVTVNDYLASRDAEWMGQIYNFLGLTVGVIVHGLDDEQRKAAYDCDVTYGTNNEFGFDYLRDNMKYRLEDMVQRGHIYAIVDEVDSILVDEARTPLIISGPLDDRSDFYNTIDAFIPKLDKADYEVDEKQRTVTLTEAGMEKMERALRDAGLLKGEFALRRRERLDRAPRQSGAARAQAVPARQGLHRAQRRGRHHRRVHRPHDAGPALFGRAAPGARGQGAPADPAGEPDARLDHVPELLPHVREARRHDRHGADRGRRVHRHLQSRRGRDPDQHADDPHRRRRRGLSHGDREIPRHHHADRGLQEARPADAGRHDLDREIGATRRSCCASTAGSSTTSPIRTRSPRSIPATRGRPRPRCSPSSTRATTSRRPTSSRRPACPGAITIATNMAGRGTDIQLGGNADMRIRQELQDIEGEERDAPHRRDPRAGRAAEGEGARRRRPVRARHRTPREPAHRQPAARPLRPPGRPRPFEVLPVARRRPDAHLRVRQARRHAAEARAARRTRRSSIRGSTRRWKRRSRRSRRATSTSARTC